MPNHGVDGKSNLVHAVYISIDGAWIDPWQDSRSTRSCSDRCNECYIPPFKSESFQMFSSFINYIVKETSMSSTVIISFDSYCENSLKALTRKGKKGDHLSLQVSK